MGIHPLTMELHRAVFLDRDGVINRAIVRDGRPYPPASLEELEIIPEARAGLEALHAEHFLLIVVTNQPDVARGLQTRGNVEAIHASLQASLPIDRFMVCYHDDADNCQCRKPAPGLLLEAADLDHIDLKRSFMIGDRWRDVAAGQRAGLTTVFIDYHYNEQQPLGPDFRVSSLAEAIEAITGSSKSAVSQDEDKKKPEETPKIA